MANRKEFVIFGAGGLARELAAWVQRDETVHLLALISDKHEELSPRGSMPVLTRAQAERQFGSPSFVLGFADPLAKHRVADELITRGWCPMTWIDPAAIVAPDARLGAGTVVCAGCTVSPGTWIGEHVLLNIGCGIGHDSRVGSYASLLGKVSVNGNVTIGDEALVGSAAVIMPKRSIGARATVGIGSVVITNVPESASVFGNPARRVQQ